MGIVQAENERGIEGSLVVVSKVIDLGLGKLNSSL
jgi:hypothetical protein